jgi:hypothetical protein
MKLTIKVSVLLICLFLSLSCFNILSWSDNRGILVNASAVSQPTLLSIPGGVFGMGDYYGFGDPQHPSDEIPIHNVSISSFSIGQNDITVQQYCDYLNSALSKGIIRVSSGLVYLTGGTDNLFLTRQA